MLPTDPHAALEILLELGHDATIENGFLTVMISEDMPEPPNMFGFDVLRQVMESVRHNPQIASITIVPPDEVLLNTVGAALGEAIFEISGRPVPAPVANYFTPKPGRRRSQRHASKPWNRKGKGSC